jgi:hypothetical protein
MTDDGQAGGADHELAQVNIMRLKAPLDALPLQPFVAALDPVNALADQAPGFVWRLKTPEGDATAFRIFGDDMLLVNMSTWTSLEALHDYVYRTAHVEIMRRRREFALPVAAGEVSLALWWVAAGHRPTVKEAEERLRHLRVHGPTPFAFSPRSPFPASASLETPIVRDDDTCRV